MKVLARAVPLIEALYPDRTHEQRTSLLNVFSAAHELPLEEIRPSHVDVLAGTLRFWLDYSKGIACALAGASDDLPAWSGIEDECPGCRDFKATMLEIQTGLKVEVDADGHVVSPILVQEDPSGRPISVGFKDWIVHGGPNLEG